VVGENIVQVHVDRVLGNVVTVLPPGFAPRVTARATARRDAFGGLHAGP
jgi:hypothetical protein